tara:strand:- start:8756 stop:10672 length:1917 start_codon:yes stop_codon:yes gene_type:complete
MAAEESLIVKVEYVDVFDFPDLSSVGHVYQVGINGTGYMLADHPEKGQEYRRQVIPLDPQRLATSDTPFSEAIERYSFAAADTWDAGAGQKYLHRGSSTASGYWESTGLDPFTDPGKIKLLPSVVLEEAESYASLRHVVVGNTLYIQTGDLALKYVTSPSASPQAITVASSGAAVTDLTSDGQKWYACNGTDIHRGTTGSNPGAWSTQNAYEVEWAAGRICAAVASAGSTPNRFTTLNDSGAEEKANGHLTLPEGTTITLGGSTGGHFYFGGSTSATGSVYAWKLGLDESGDFFVPFEALKLPDGLEVATVATGGGYVWVRAYRPEGSNKGQALLYQCAVDGSGALIATVVTEIAPVGTTADHKVGAFATHEDLMLFGWKTMANSHAGTGAVSLTTGGWAKWYEASVDGDVSSISIWQGLPVFSIRGHGVYRTHASQFVTAGELKTSFADGASGLFKVWDDVTLTMDPLGTGESITVTATVDGGANYSSLTGGTVSEQLKTHTVEIGKQSKELGLKLSFVGNASGDCALTFLSTRYHPLGLADTLVQIPIDCGDHLKGMNGAPLGENGEGAGIRRARTLQNLVQTRVKFQDIDWHVTGSTDVFEVEACDLQAVTLYEPSRSGSAIRLIATLTLRKVGS